MTLASTTFAAAVSETAEAVRLASVTGILVGDLLVHGLEAMRVDSIIGTVARVTRGHAGTPAIAHASGATVYVAAPAALYWRAPIGVPPSPVLVTPWIDLRTGDVWTVVAGAWVKAAAAGSSTDATQTAAIAALVSNAAIKIASARIDNAAIKLLPTTPVIIEAAPGADRINYALFAVLALNTVAGAYTNVHQDGVIAACGASKPIDAFLNVAGIAQALISIVFSGAADYRNGALSVSIDNAAAGVLGGGHADNFLDVGIYYVPVTVLA